MTSRVPFRVQPMLASLAPGPFHRPGWLYEEKLGSLWRRFQSLIIPKPPFSDPPREKGVTWLAPRLVAQVAFAEITADRRLRQPSFLGLRDDTPPEACELPAEAA